MTSKHIDNLILVTPGSLHIKFNMTSKLTHITHLSKSRSLHIKFNMTSKHEEVTK